MNSIDPVPPSTMAIRNVWSTTIRKGSVSGLYFDPILRDLPSIASI